MAMYEVPFVFDGFYWGYPLVESIKYFLFLILDIKECATAINSL